MTHDRSADATRDSGSQGGGRVDGDRAPRTTDWIMTASGRPFWPLEPRVEDVSIADIAHHLSHCCRFAGAVRTFYSVAQHSVLVSRAMSWPAYPLEPTEGAALYGLLHDAAEAYLTDVPRPLKHAPAFQVYRAAETTLQAVIYEAFGLTLAHEPPALKAIDRRMLRTEQRDLMPPPGLDERRDDVEPFPEALVGWAPAFARRAFLARFAVLTGPEGDL
jgi:hypothetical protein